MDTVFPVNGGHDGGAGAGRDGTGSTGGYIISFALPHARSMRSTGPKFPVPERLRMPHQQFDPAHVD